MSLVRYPVADLAGELVWASDMAELDSRPKEFTCLGCAGIVRLRAGNRNRPHFAHVADAACSGGETALHRTTIRILQAAILEASSIGRPYSVICACERCGAERVANLARAGSIVNSDQVLEEGIRPDLVVRGSTGRPLVVVEVIVTHAPEISALAVFDRLSVPVVRIWPTWEALVEMRTGLGVDLSKSRERKVGCFEVAGSCRFPRHRTSGTVPCPSCEEPARQLSVEVSRAECWSCFKTFPVLDFIDCTEDHLVLVSASCPEIPNAKAIAAARGVRLDVKYSKAAGGSYLMHLCTHCKRIQGDNFLYAADGAITDVSLPAWTVTLCENGHLERGQDIAWPPNSTSRRPFVAAGLVGEPAHLFRRAARGDFTVTELTPANRKQLINKMMGLGQW